MNLKKIIISTIALLVITNTAKSFACSCIMPESPEKELEKSSKVFIGRVLSVEKEKSLNELLGGMQKKVVEFEVKANIKGTSNKEINLTTAESSASCGYNFEENKEYVVYANEYDGKLNASLCSRTNLVENATEDLEAFKEILNSNQDENGNNENVSQKETKISNTAYVLLIILFALTIGIVIKKNFKNKKN